MTRMHASSLGALSAMALPLAFVTLPLYVLLPNRYATEFDVSLSAIGTVLLAVRALDALLDPWLGQQCDQWFAQGSAYVQRVSFALAIILALAFAGLWLPHVWLAFVGQHPGSSVLMVAAPCLIAAYLAATGLNLALQTWGCRFGGGAHLRSRITAWREGFGLVGVVLASLLPTWLDPISLTLALCLLLALAVYLWRFAPQTHRLSEPAVGEVTHRSSWQTPLKTIAFRRLLHVFLLNGIASAIPATLVLFFIQDLLQAPAGSEGLFLGIYFVAGAVSFPLWLILIQRTGLAQAWLVGQGLSVLVFVWAITLGAGDWMSFALICFLSGVALGADLTIPGAMLTGVIQRCGDGERAEGVYIGWWQVATKLNLALAAGLALPLLQFFGYSAGTRNAEGLWALSVAYAALPCLLKLLAMWRLWAARSELWETSHDE